MVDKKDNNKKEEDEAVVKVAPRIRRFGRRMGDKQSPTSSTWLISFTDVMALMLTFFVLLFAMSNPKQEEWEQFTQNMQQNFNKFEGEADNRGTQDAINISAINYSKALDIKYLRSIIEKLVESDSSLGQVTLMENAGRLIISLPQDILFDAGRTEVKEEGKRALSSLVGSLRRIKNNVEIVGHTDPRPISNSGFPSNWELSLTRAASVAGIMRSVGYNQSLSIKGYAGGRYDDLPKTLPKETRMDLSRRVDIIIREDDGKRFKLFDIGLPGR